MSALIEVSMVREPLNEADSVLQLFGPTALLDETQGRVHRVHEVADAGARIVARRFSVPGATRSEDLDGTGATGRAIDGPAAGVLTLAATKEGDAGIAPCLDALRAALHGRDARPRDLVYWFCALPSREAWPGAWKAFVTARRALLGADATQGTDALPATTGVHHAADRFSLLAVYARRTKARVVAVSNPFLVDPRAYGPEVGERQSLPYSRAIFVEGGDTGTLFVSGHLPLMPRGELLHTDPALQTAHVVSLLTALDRAFAKDRAAPMRDEALALFGRAAWEPGRLALLEDLIERGGLRYDRVALEPVLDGAAVEIERIVTYRVEAP